MDQLLLFSLATKELAVLSATFIFPLSVFSCYDFSQIMSCGREWENRGGTGCIRLKLLNCLLYSLPMSGKAHGPLDATRSPAGILLNQYPCLS